MPKINKTTAKALGTLGGKASAKKRLAGKNKEERSALMRTLAEKRWKK
jgi:hypothetical protein